MSSDFKEGYALLIGIANYSNVKKLSDIVLKDAEDIYNLLLSREHCGYLPENCRLLLDKKADKAGIIKKIKWLSESTRPNSTALIFFSGHGARIENELESENYLLPYDSDPNNIGTTGISGKEMTSLFRSINAERLLVIFDCCHSGGIGEAKGDIREKLKFKSGLNEGLYEQLAKGKGRVIIASSRSDECSLILRGMENSLFTHYLLETLKGDIRNKKDGLIRVFDIFDYVSEKVPERASQHPIFKAADVENNFAVTLCKTAYNDCSYLRTTLEIRKLLNLLSDDDFIELCFIDFREVYNNFTESQTRRQRVRKLIEYAEQHEQLDKLSEAIKRIIPEKFKKLGANYAL